MYSYGLIGNCNVSALVSSFGAIDWMCLPRPDSEPIFGRLLDPNGGTFEVLSDKDTKAFSHQTYQENTNILITTIENQAGDIFRIIDFCPRFEQYGRMFRPLALFRIIEPLRGAPHIRINCQPVDGWSKNKIPTFRGNSHIRFDKGDDFLRLTTNMPLTYLEQESYFQLTERLYFALTWNSPVEEDLAELTEKFLLKTDVYWRTWVKHCSIPSLYQKETIRSALTLKLHCFEDTGAILAALTTSLPEEFGGQRNWDYRYCWLRDAYFVLSALHNLGHFEEMEGFVRFLLNIAHKTDHSKEHLAPVYALDQKLPHPEEIISNWAGFKNSGPVRVRNQASEHIQNDVYGEMVLTLSPIFFDERFRDLRTKEHENLLARFAAKCSESIGQADAGLWEFRHGWQEHTFTNLTAWAGLERLSRIQQLGYLKDLKMDLSLQQQRSKMAVLKALKEQSLRNGPHDENFDASLSLMAVFRFPDEQLSLKTIQDIQRALAVDKTNKGFYFRYSKNDDFGQPQSAFVVCSFWIAQALGTLKRHDEARLILETAMKAANSLGLYSEHFDPKRQQQLGNFPQAYSHVGQINAAFAASPPWMDIL